MNTSKRELQEWILFGERAFNRLPPTQKGAVTKRVKVRRERAVVNGHIIEYDKVIEY
jgi:hypothetical protein